MEKSFRGEALLVLVKNREDRPACLIALTELWGDMDGKERPYYLAGHTLPLSSLPS